MEVEGVSDGGSPCDEDDIRAIRKRIRKYLNLNQMGGEYVVRRPKSCMRREKDGVGDTLEVARLKRLSLIMWGLRRIHSDSWNITSN